MKPLFLYLWQLPQNLVALLLILCYGAVRVHTEKGVSFYAARRMPGAISLGRYVLLSIRYASREDICAHEYGHTVQYRRWGIFYLFVIGLPSIINAAVGTGEYYDFYTEKSANKLGGVAMDDMGRLVIIDKVLTIPIDKIKSITAKMR